MILTRIFAKNYYRSRSISIFENDRPMSTLAVFADQYGPKLFEIFLFSTPLRIILPNDYVVLFDGKDFINP